MLQVIPERVYACAEGVVRNLMLNVGMFVWVCAAHTGHIPPVVSCAGG